MHRAGSLALLLAGCVDLQPYSTTALVTYEDGSSVTVDGRAYVASFGGQEYPLLSILNVEDGPQMLGSLDYSDPGVKPADESGIGYSLADVIAINGDGAVDDDASETIHSTLEGPAVAQVQIDITIEPVVAGGNLMASTQFTLFPNGQIVRHDALTLTAAVAASNGLSSYASLSGAQIQNYQVDASPQPFHDGSGSGSATDASLAGTTVCASPDGGPQASTAITFGYRDVVRPVAATGSSGLRARGNQGMGIVIFDWLDGAGGVPAGDYALTTDMQLSGPDLHAGATLDCESLLQVVAARNADDRAALDGNLTDTDGMYHVMGNGLSDIAITSDKTTQVGFALAIVFSNDVSSIDVEAPPTSDPVLVQKDDASHYYVWYPGKIESTDTITIVPHG